MIQKECFNKEWIDKVCSSHKFKHPELVEKVIRAFSLLEMLVKEGCPLTFKGGTSLLKSHIYVGRYTLDMAISDAAKAAYLATVIQYGLNTIEKYSGNVTDVMNMTISPVISKEVAKIRRGNPEAFYYWCRISEILNLRQARSGRMG